MHENQPMCQKDGVQIKGIRNGKSGPIIIVGKEERDLTYCTTSEKASPKDD